MPAPAETLKLPRGMGRLIRHTQAGPWTWQRWDPRCKKWTCRPTGEANRSKAEQFVYQQAAVRDEEKFRYQGIAVLFSTLADEYVEARSTGRGSKNLRPTRRLRTASIRKLDTALNAFTEFIGPDYRSLQADQLDGTLLREFVLSQARRVSTGTANHRLDCVSQVLEFGVRRHLLLHNPAPKVERAFTETADGDGDPADDAIVPELEVILDHLCHSNRNNAWVFETRRGTQLGATNPTKRFRQICEVLGFKKHFVVHSLRKYWASTVAQQGMDWKVMLKMFGHSDFELILSTYYAQNDDARLVEEASKIDFGLGLPKSA